MGPVGIQEILIIGVVLALIFGINRLPKMGKNLGEGIANFRESLREFRRGVDEENGGGS